VSIRLAVLGDPLRYTRSPELHRAGCAALGLACESEALRTPVDALPATLERLAREGYAGCNLTMPLKEPALDCVARPSPAARRARSVNTITFSMETGVTLGDTTDGAGFLDLLAQEGRDPASVRVVLLGAGGSARSLALAIAERGGEPVRVVSRHEPEPGDAWGGALGERWSAWGSLAADRAVAQAQVLVNCTPLGNADLPQPRGGIAPDALVVDLPYGEAPSAWVTAARAAGLDAVDGLALLVHQARHSFRCWFDRDVPLELLLAAVRRSP